MAMLNGSFFDRRRQINQEAHQYQNLTDSTDPPSCIDAVSSADRKKNDAMLSLTLDNSKTFDEERFDEGLLAVQLRLSLPR
jgi:hypothetical protein